MSGVVRVGEIAKTSEPVPVSSVTAARRFAEVGVARKVATPDAKPLTPVEIGSPVQLVRVPADGVPMFGVTRVGLVANTNDPDPVSSVTAVDKFADVGVVRKVAIPEPKPLMPVETGSPVQLVRVPAEGAPMSGVTREGLVANTSDPDPVSSLMTPAS